MLLALAWRNIWRNARRSLITMAALALGVAGLVGLRSYRDITFSLIVRDITQGLLGHIQVHGAGYQEAPSIHTVVGNPVQVEAALKEALPGATAERRVLGGGLAGARDSSAPVMILGLSAAPPGERGLTSLVSGKELSASHEVHLGRDLARDLGVGPGDEVVLVSQAADGSTANDRYTVVGTVVSASAGLDATAVLMSLEDAQDYFGLGSAVHQVVVRLPPGVDADDLGPQVSALRGALDLKTLEALSWSQMMPDLKEMMRSKQQGQKALDFVVFLIVALGVFNAMSMATFERTRELGVLGALGTRPGRILGMVLLEALLQGVLGLLAGVFLGWSVLTALGTVSLGDVMSGDIMGTKMPTRIELALSPGAVWAASVVALGTVLAGGLWPAWRAARRQPVEAMRHT